MTRPDGNPEGLHDGQEPQKPNLRMRFGTDMRYHFEDPDLRKRGGDSEDVEWMEFDPDILLREVFET